jgi:hypothetical protein
MLRDVQATRIQWLEDRWVEYHQLKAQLISDAPKLRLYLAQEAIDERARAHAGRGGLSAASAAGVGGKGRPQTADQKATSAMEAATRYRATQARGGSSGGGGLAAAPTPAQQKAMSAMEAAAAYRANKK